MNPQSFQSAATVYFETGLFRMNRCNFYLGFALVPYRAAEQLHETYEEKVARKTVRSKIAAAPTHSTLAKEVNLADKDPDNSEEKGNS